MPKIVRFHQLGGPENLKIEELPSQQPGEGEVRLRGQALGLNRAESMFCKKTMSRLSLDPKLATMGTVLHEASHNLGPSHEYKVDGKTDEEIFGGVLASQNSA